MDIQTISIAIAAASVVVGAILAVLELKDLVKTRKTQLIIQLNPSLNVSQAEMQEAWSTMWNLEFKDYDDFVKKYGDLFSEGSVPIAIGTISSYFAAIGFLLHKKLIDLDVVEYIEGGTAKMAWEKLKPIFEGFSRKHNLPNVMPWFEYLYNETLKRERQMAKIQ